jgi:ATP-binding cassette, subfamily B, bacterial
MSPWRRAFQFYRDDRRRLVAILGLLFLSVGANLLKPWPVALLIDSVLGDKPLPSWIAGAGAADWPKGNAVAVLGLAAFVIYLFQGTIDAGQNFISIQAGLRGLMRARNAVFACLQRLSLKFHQGTKSGDLIYRASWDTYSIQTLFQQGLLTFLKALISLCMMVVVMLKLNGELTLVALGTVPLLFLVIRFFGKKMTERGAAAQQADSAVTSQVQQTVVALPLIQSYTREDYEQTQFNTQTLSAHDTRLAQHAWELVYWLAIGSVFGLGAAAIIWMGGREVLAGKLTVGDLFIFLTYLGQLYDPLNQLSHVGATVSSASAAAGRVFELLDTPEEVKDGKRGVSRVGDPSPGSGALLVCGEVCFDHVNFGYTSERAVLRDISFRLKPGESAAIIGPSGVGKTTLMNLLPRFYDPTSGSVSLDGVDLRELKLRDLRSQIAVVLQEPILLPASIAENIAYGKPGASREEIESAAKSANADVFIRRLPRGYDTSVGDGASRLSVGERQRLNLARAFLKNAPVLLLDEPTSALDAESEQLVVQSLHELRRGRTVLMVAHRLSTIRRVTKIVVIQDGTIAESGSHEELVQRDGYYARVTRGLEPLE